jgi:hypothetical protein
LRSIYGLKQSPHEWNKDIDAKLKELGFRCCEADPNLYIPTFEKGCFLLLYVDDILLVGLSDGISNVKRMIMPLYKMKDLGPAIYYLGIDISTITRWTDQALTNALYRKDPRTFWNDGLQRSQIANEKGPPGFR